MTSSKLERKNVTYKFELKKNLIFYDARIFIPMYYEFMTAIMLFEFSSNLLFIKSVLSYQWYKI